MIYQEDDQKSYGKRQGDEEDPEETKSRQEVLCQGKDVHAGEEPCDREESKDLRQVVWSQELQGQEIKRKSAEAEDQGEVSDS